MNLRDQAQAMSVSSVSFVAENREMKLTHELPVYIHIPTLTNEETI